MLRVLCVCMSARLRSERDEARGTITTLEAERQKWLAQLEVENAQLKQLFQDAKLAKEQLVLVCMHMCSVEIRRLFVCAALCLRERHALVCQFANETAYVCVLCWPHDIA